MISALFSRLVILSFGTLYPAYSSYKAIRTRNVKEYVKWMMYWIVYALFTCIETLTDIFLSWFPFYYEIKVIIVLWLLSPATKGSSTLYKKFVHPALAQREQEIDEYLNQAKERGYSTVLQLGSKGVNYATNVIMQTAIKTINMAMNKAGNPPGQMLLSSQSDAAIYEHTQSYQEGLVGPAGRDPWNASRTRSVDALTMMQNEFSEDEAIDVAMNTERVVIAEINTGEGAARSRNLPIRKTKSRSTPAAPTGKSKAPEPKKGGVGIRSRRRIREDTPDIDIEAE